ncbi:bifunctional adenosylcobinamide kinase/adenosylcobinamide-phosphate guanylyltransferase [Pseudooceanicola sp. MF1-13]|uniref:bifunctional adenosylcobinamide kinase/adenosylcobinamide-phosphate guanylyltransferase n=1 Tax=Pseudooceanicola sp. MF1-13 TaxID=3379095 RepID=UPI0038920440
MQTPLTLILGGAASGKSAFAEKTVLAQGGTPVYIATAQAWDDEMRAKIQAHVTARGPHWTTIEAPFDLAEAIEKAGSAPILIDCLTLWLTNLILAEKDVQAETDTLIAALSDSPAPITMVTNEVGQGIVPDNALSRQFREAQGRLNIRMAAQATRVAQVIVGLPNVLKGSFE